ncbi:type II toxin-antitoxin system Phd/YefM family antitoxin [Tundrisphaera sp. TA3]
MNLPQLLERVARGERITILDHGVPMAVLVPPQAPHSG